MTQKLVSVLDADPELGTSLDPESAAVARREAVAPISTVWPGAWDEAVAPTGPGDFGHLLLRGLVACEFGAPRRRAMELLGAGDILRPRDTEVALGSTCAPPVWRIVRPTRMLTLDAEFAARIAPWPTLATSILGRVGERSRWLALQLLVSQSGRLDKRLMLFLLLCAQRWGRVVPEGTKIPIPFTHAMLGRMIGAQRPSVSVAVGRLQGMELVSRTKDGAWLLRSRPEGFERLLEMGAGTERRPRTALARRPRPRL